MSEVTQPEATVQPARAPRRFELKHLLSLLFAVGITVVLFVFRDEVGKLDSFGYAGIFLTLLLTNATLILPAPTLAIVFVLGKSFSPLLLGVVAGAGSALGEFTGYAAGFSSSGVVENTEAYKRVEGYIKKYDVVAIAFLAAIPNPLFDVAGLAAGALGIVWWKFLVATFIGKTIKMIAVAYAGFYSVGLIEQFLK
jgi:membrane protein YqaA with SNARE-associated domain